MANETQFLVNSHVKAPKDAFPRCPCCRSAGLKEMHDGINVSCACGWDSTEAFADAGGLDWWESHPDPFYLLEQLSKQQVHADQKEVPKSYETNTANAVAG